MNTCIFICKFIYFIITKVIKVTKRWKQDYAFHDKLEYGFIFLNVHIYFVKDRYILLNKYIN